MKIVNNILYIQFTDFITAGWSEDSIKKANYRNGTRWQMITDPDDGRAVLVQYETLTDSHKEKLTAAFGEPYLYVSKQPIKALVTTDLKAQEFYVAHRFEGDKALPTAHIVDYTKAASWLNMLVRLNENKKYIKNELHLSLEQFYSIVIEIIKAENIALPTSYKYLTAKMREYKAEGYPCLIDWRFGNTNSKKVNDEVSESILMDLIAHPNQYDDVLIAWQYNQWAAKQSPARPTITDQTVGNYRRRNYHLVIGEREGRSAFNDKFIKQVPRLRPTTPLYFVNHDDNHLDLYFTNEDDKTPHKFYHKYKAIVVIDGYNDHVLGYAYDLQVSNDLIRRAYLNAMYYIKEKTGGWYLPHEIKSDRFGSKELKPLYQSMGHYHDTPVGSKGSGYIEQCFSRPFFKRCMKLGANNYSGNNITARNAGVNREMLDINKKLRPTTDDAAYQIESFFHRLRHMPQGEGKLSKEQEWLQAWSITPDENKKPISDESFMLIFGTVANDKGITITNRGVEPQINNVQYRYELPHDIISQYVGMKVQVLYDPMNMDRVMLTNFNDFRCIATTPKYIPSALADYKEGSRTDLNKILSLKRQQVEYAAERTTKRKTILLENNIDTEAILQAGVAIPKLLKQQAEQMHGVQINQQSSEKQQEYLDNNYDFDQFFNNQNSNNE